MAFARAWRRSADGACWRTVAPRAASAFRPDAGVGAKRGHGAARAPQEAGRFPRRRRPRARNGRRPVSSCRPARTEAEHRRLAVGFTASRQVGIAVERNRARRRLKEAARRYPAAMPRRADYVVIARAETLTRQFRDLVVDLETALQAPRCMARRGAPNDACAAARLHPALSAHAVAARGARPAAICRPARTMPTRRSTTHGAVRGAACSRRAGSSALPSLGRQRLRSRAARRRR